MHEVKALTREQLRAEIDRIDTARKAIEEQAAPIRAQLEPYKQKIAAPGEEELNLLDPHGNLLGRCESCNALIFAGDKGWRYEEGPMFCSEHSPTYGDLLEEIKTFPADEWDEEEYGPLSAAIAGRETLVADHGADTICAVEL